MDWHRIVLAVIAGLLAASSPAAAQEKLPRYWRKTMVADPAVNYALKRYSAPLASELATQGRNILFVFVLGNECEGAQIDGERFRDYLAKARVTRLSEAELKPVSDTVGASVNGFDYRALAHLCSSVDWMFGASGSLATGLLKQGTGEPKRRYDASNPFMRLPTLADMRVR